MHSVLAVVVVGCRSRLRPRTPRRRLRGHHHRPASACAHPPPRHPRPAVGPSRTGRAPPRRGRNHERQHVGRWTTGY
eukprot:153415-Pyramimonas_sp.AAC.1